MYNIHAERSAGYSAVAYVIVLLVAGLIPGTPPPLNASAAEIASYVTAHQSMLLLASWLAFPGIAFFLWYVVGLRAYLRQAPGQDEGLGDYLLAAGLLTAVVALVSAVFQAVLGYHAGDLGAVALRVLYDAFAISGILLYIPLAIYVLAASLSSRRHHSFPPLLTALGFVSALGAGISTLSIFFKGGVLAPNGALTLILGLVLYGIWTIGTGIVLVRDAGKTR
ncbi:MAG TPA: hypothetical protein VIG32_02760 [Candidatus Baltobacteraceae bacterium]|jgi:hypothetical protein